MDVDLTPLLRSFTSTSAASSYRKNIGIIVNSTNKKDYEKKRLETGLCKPSLLAGVAAREFLGPPGCFAADVMHLPCLNLPELFLGLWRGTLDCDKSDSKEEWPWYVLKGEIWKVHGAKVASATPYIPGSFDRPPRNIAEKINSGYKAWEYLLYFFGMGPCLLHGVLPTPFWRNYCKLVRSFRILLQENIFPEELDEAEKLILEFADEFESLYVQRRADRIHFVRPSIHASTHIPFETRRVGPGIIYSQWTMERTIGNLGEEIRQHSTPFLNLASRALRRCQVNALTSLLPTLVNDKSTSNGSFVEDIGQGFIGAYSQT